jgi:hypothetical protein
MKTNLPNFFVVGAPKCGTTSVYNYLSQHPDIFLPSKKELNFFSSQEIIFQNLYYDSFMIEHLKDYKHMYKKSKNSDVTGDFSVSYLFYKDTPKKIKNSIPDAKIIIFLRDPSERAFSHYLMDYRLGYLDIPLEELIKKPKKFHLYYQQIIELGLYYKQVKRYKDIFGDNVKIILFEQLKNNTSFVLKDILGFIGVDNTVDLAADKKHNPFKIPKNNLVKKMYTHKKTRNFFSYLTPKIFRKFIFSNFFSNVKPTISSTTKKSLSNLFEDDIKRLEKLINEDLSDWYKN